MKKTALLLLLIVGCGTIFAQEDLDDVFDDGDKDSKIHVGTNITTLLGGTINAGLDLSPIEKLTLNVGAGFMPFSTHRDLSFWRPQSFDDGSMQVKDTAVSGGNYLTFALKFNANMFSDIDFDYYYYISYKRKNFNLMDDIIAVNQNKISLGLGYKFGLIGRFNTEIQFGVFSGSDITTLNSDNYTFTGLETRGVTLYEMNDFEKRRVIGFDLGISLTYAL